MFGLTSGSTVAEMSYTAPCTNQLFESKEHGGFVFIRATYQCVQQLLLPKPPFLVALLIHRYLNSVTRTRSLMVNSFLD